MLFPGKNCALIYSTDSLLGARSVGKCRDLLFVAFLAPFTAGVMSVPVLAFCGISTLIPNYCRNLFRSRHGYILEPLNVVRA